MVSTLHCVVDGLWKAYISLLVACLCARNNAWPVSHRTLIVVCYHLMSVKCPVPHLPRSVLRSPFHSGLQHIATFANCVPFGPAPTAAQDVPHYSVGAAGLLSAASLLLSTELAPPRPNAIGSETKTGL